MHCKRYNLLTRLKMYICNTFYITLKRIILIPIKTYFFSYHMPNHLSRDWSSSIGGPPESGPENPRNNYDDYCDHLIGWWLSKQPYWLLMTIFITVMSILTIRKTILIILMIQTILITIMSNQRTIVAIQMVDPDIWHLSWQPSQLYQWPS